MDHRGFAPSPGPSTLVSSRWRNSSTMSNLCGAPLVCRAWRYWPFRTRVHGAHAPKYPQHTSHLVMIGIAPDLSPATPASPTELPIARRRASPRAEQASMPLPDEELAKLTGDQAFTAESATRLRTWRSCVPTARACGRRRDQYGHVNHVWGKGVCGDRRRQRLDQLDRPVFLASAADFIVAPPALGSAQIEFSNLAFASSKERPYAAARRTATIRRAASPAGWTRTATGSAR